MSQNELSPIISPKVVVKNAAGESVDASVFEVLEELVRVYEATRVLHPGATRYDLSGSWRFQLAQLLWGEIEWIETRQGGAKCARAEFVDVLYPGIGKPMKDEPDKRPDQARTDIEAPCVVCGELLARTRWGRPYHPSCKERYDKLTRHETYYLVKSWTQNGIITTLTNPARWDHRPLDSGANYISAVPHGRPSDNSDCPICFPPGW